MSIPLLVPSKEVVVFELGERFMLYIPHHPSLEGKKDSNKNHDAKKTHLYQYNIIYYTPHNTHNNFES